MRILLFIAVVVTILSCKKENPTNNNPNEIKLEHLPLSVGNYWVYEHYLVDTIRDINERTGSVKDSIVIVGDTIINSKKYFVRKGISPFNGLSSWGLLDIVRDSSGYLVDVNGNVLFAENNFIDTFNLWSFVIYNDTIADVYYNMENYYGNISTPSGNYNSGLNYKETVILFIQDSTYIRYNKNIYVKDIGKVLETYFFISPTPSWYEKRLSHYYVK